MLTDRQLYELTELIIDTARQIEIEMLMNLATRFELNSEIGGTARWQLEQLNQLGLLHEESIRIISRYSGKTVNEVKKMISDASIKSINIELLDDVFDLGLVTINPRSINLQPIIETFQKSIEDEMRLILTNAITNSNVQYQAMIDKVTLEVTGGFKSYNQAMQDALNELADKGITATRFQGINKNGDPYVIEYPIEASVRRSVFTAINQVANESNAKYIEELNPPQIAVSQHFGARNKGHGHENHESWQGRAYDNDGTFEKVTGYKNPDNLGLAGYGCRHIQEPFYPGISVPLEDRIPDEENSKQYELEQRQRVLEKGVRNAKKRFEMAKSTDDKEYVEKTKKLRDRRLERLGEHVKSNGLTRDFSRERISKNYREIPIES